MCCHSSRDLLSWDFLSWFQVRVTPAPPQLHPGSTDQANRLYLWGGSNKPLSPAVTHPSACSSARPSVRFQPVRLCVLISAGHTCLCVHLPAGPFLHLPASLCAWPRLPTCLYLPVCLCATWPDRCVCIFFRAWLVGWPTSRLIRLTYRRAADTHTHACRHTHINMNAQALHSASRWPSALAQTANHRLISTTDLRVFKECSLISSTTYVQKDPALQARLECFSYF